MSRPLSPPIRHDPQVLNFPNPVITIPNKKRGNGKVEDKKSKEPTKNKRSKKTYSDKESKKAIEQSGLRSKRSIPYKNKKEERKAFWEAMRKNGRPEKKQKQKKCPPVKPQEQKIVKRSQFGITLSMPPIRHKVRLREPRLIRLNAPKECVNVDFLRELTHHPISNYTQYIFPWVDSQKAYSLNYYVEEFSGKLISRNQCEIFLNELQAKAPPIPFCCQPLYILPGILVLLTMLACTLAYGLACSRNESTCVASKADLAVGFVLISGMGLISLIYVCWLTCRFPSRIIMLKNHLAGLVIMKHLDTTFAGLDLMIERSPLGSYITIKFQWATFSLTHANLQCDTQFAQDQQTQKIKENTQWKPPNKTNKDKKLKDQKAEDKASSKKSEKKQEPEKFEESDMKELKSNISDSS